MFRTNQLPGELQSLTIDLRRSFASQEAACLEVLQEIHQEYIPESNLVHSIELTIIGADNKEDEIVNKRFSKWPNFLFELHKQNSLDPKKTVIEKLIFKKIKYIELDQLSILATFFIDPICKNIRELTFEVTDKKNEEAIKKRLKDIGYNLIPKFIYSDEQKINPDKTKHSINTGLKVDNPVMTDQDDHYAGSFMTGGKIHINELNKDDFFGSDEEENEGSHHPFNKENSTSKKRKQEFDDSLDEPTKKQKLDSPFKQPQEDKLILESKPIIETTAILDDLWLAFGKGVSGISQVEKDKKYQKILSSLQKDIEAKVFSLHESHEIIDTLIQSTFVVMENSSKNEKSFDFYFNALRFMQSSLRYYFSDYWKKLAKNKCSDFASLNNILDKTEMLLKSIDQYKKFAKGICRSRNDKKKLGSICMGTARQKSNIIKLRAVITEKSLAAIQGSQLQPSEADESKVVISDAELGLLPEQFTPSLLASSATSLPVAIKDDASSSDPILSLEPGSLGYNEPDAPEQSTFSEFATQHIDKNKYLIPPVANKLLPAEELEFETDDTEDDKDDNYVGSFMTGGKVHINASFFKKLKETKEDSSQDEEDSIVSNAHPSSSNSSSSDFSKVTSMDTDSDNLENDLSFEQKKSAQPKNTMEQLLETTAILKALEPLYDRRKCKLSQKNRNKEYQKILNSIQNNKEAKNFSFSESHQIIDKLIQSTISDIQDLSKKEKSFDFYFNAKVFIRYCLRYYFSDYLKKLENNKCTDVSCFNNILIKTALLFKIFDQYNALAEKIGGTPENLKKLKKVHLGAVNERKQKLKLQEIIIKLKTQSTVTIKQAQDSPPKQGYDSDSSEEESDQRKPSRQKNSAVRYKDHDSEYLSDDDFVEQKPKLVNHGSRSIKAAAMDTESDKLGDSLSLQQQKNLPLKTDCDDSYVGSFMTGGKIHINPTSFAKLTKRSKDNQESDDEAKMTKNDPREKRLANIKKFLRWVLLEEKKDGKPEYGQWIILGKRTTKGKHNLKRVKDSFHVNFPKRSGIHGLPHINITGVYGLTWENYVFGVIRQTNAQGKPEKKFNQAIHDELMNEFDRVEGNILEQLKNDPSVRWQANDPGYEAAKQACYSHRIQSQKSHHKNKKYSSNSHSLPSAIIKLDNPSKAPEQVISLQLDQTQSSSSNSSNFDSNSTQAAAMETDEIEISKPTDTNPNNEDITSKVQSPDNLLQAQASSSIAPHAALFGSSSSKAATIDKKDQSLALFYPK